MATTGWASGFFASSTNPNGARRRDRARVARLLGSGPAERIGGDVESEGERARRLHEVDREVIGPVAGFDRFAVGTDLPESVVRESRFARLFLEDGALGVRTSGRYSNA